MAVSKNSKKVMKYQQSMTKLKSADRESLVPNFRTFTFNQSCKKATTTKSFTGFFNSAAFLKPQIY